MNSANLDPNVGFLHEVRVTKEPLVYDLQEPFRWLVDYTIIKAIEKKIFIKKNFIRTDGYIIRIRPDGVRKLMAELDKTLSQMVPISHNNQQSSNVIFLKAQELTNYLTEKRKWLDLSKPDVKLERIDNIDIREKFKNMSYDDWFKNGGSRGSLWCMKKKANENGPYKIHPKNQIMSR